MLADVHPPSASFTPIPIARDELQLMAKNWRNVRQFYRRTALTLIVGAINCGPVDGGCVIVAKAIQQVIGGDVMVLVRGDDAADHAVVEKDGLLWDYYRATPPVRFIPRFNAEEHADTVGWRPIRAGDLTDTPDDPVLQADLVAVFSLAFKAFLSEQALLRNAAR